MKSPRILPKLSMLIVTLLLIKLHQSQASYAKPGCQEICGNITIPYPFGIGTGCYLYKSFEVLCDGSSQDRYPLRFANIQKLPIIEFSTNLVRVVNESTAECNSDRSSMSMGSGFADQYFFYSKDHNLYVAFGCDISATFLNNGGVGRGEVLKCESLCNKTIPIIEPVVSCTGFNGCCQLNIPENTTSFGFTIKHHTNSSGCGHVFVTENTTHILVYDMQLHLPVALKWVVALTTCHQASKNGHNLCGANSYCIDSTSGLGYNCECKEGYKGNPYLPDGCQDVNQCPKESNHYCEEGETCEYTHGSYKCISLLIRKSNVSVTYGILIGVSAFCGAIGYLAYRKIDRIRTYKMKKKFFNKNGGCLLKQQMSSIESCIMTIQVYTAEDMKKATRNFSRSMFLGKGGQGTVYKGLFPDETIVAIKKSNVVDVDRVERFVNEVLILAQINHRNIVKLLGCCLEYEVPLLVYEYLANDTLSQRLHDEAESSTFSWKDRIRIAREVAGALAYLHSYASPPIFHRDIKSSNILLDQNYKAVISDFGLSKSVPLSRSHLTTQVEGTFGYLDPEYSQSGKLTAKSDVYSFGVVLTELLIGKMSNSSSDSGEGLVPRFKYLVKHNQLVEILDKQVIKEAMVDDVLLVAKLAKRCMKMNSKKRPSMEEVVTELNKLIVVQPTSSMYNMNSQPTQS